MGDLFWTADHEGDSPLAAREGPEQREEHLAGPEGSQAGSQAPHTPTPRCPAVSVWPYGRDDVVYGGTASMGDIVLSTSSTRPTTRMTTSAANPESEPVESRNTKMPEKPRPAPIE